MPTAIDLHERRNKLIDDYRKIVEAAETEDRNLTQEEKNQAALYEADLKDIDERIERQRALERTPATDPARREPTTDKRFGRDSEEYRAAFNDWLRFGGDAPLESRQILASAGKLDLNDGERRALSAINPTAGGYLAPAEFRAQFDDALLAYGGMRAAATVITTDNGNDLSFPTGNDTTNTGEIVAESAAFSTQDLAFSLVTFKAFKYSSKIVLVPWELLQDSAIDIEGYISQKLGERIGRIQNTHFTLGVGASQPTGITATTGTPVGGSVQGRAGATGTATSITADDLIRLIHSVDPAYRTGAKFMLSDASLLNIRLIKDGDGQYIWKMGMTESEPDRIFSYPYVINQDMPAMAASQNSVLFGQLSKYIIRQVSDVQLLRLNELYAANGQVGFLAWSRADGALIDAGTNPVKHFTNSAA